MIKLHAVSVLLGLSLRVKQNTETERESRRERGTRTQRVCSCEDRAGGREETQGNQRSQD